MTQNTSTIAAFTGHSMLHPIEEGYYSSIIDDDGQPCKKLHRPDGRVVLWIEFLGQWVRVQDAREGTVCLDGEETYSVALRAKRLAERQAREQESAAEARASVSDCRPAQRDLDDILNGIMSAPEHLRDALRQARDLAHYKQTRG